MRTARDDRSADDAAQNRETPSEVKRSAFARLATAWLPTAEATWGIQKQGRHATQRAPQFQNTETIFRSLVEQIPAVTYTAALDPASTTLYVSPQIQALLGFTPAAYRENPDIWQQQLHPDDRERVLEQMRQSHLQHHPFSSEYRMLTRTGQTVWVKDRATVVTDVTGKPFVLQGVMFDITERKQAEEENQRFRTISDNAVYGKAIADLHGNLIYTNRFHANIHGYDPEEVIGKHFSIFHSQAQWQEETRRIANLIRDGHFAPTTVWHRHRDGTDFPMLMSGVLIKDDQGTPQYIAASAIDITEKERNKKDLEDIEWMLSGNHTEKTHIATAYGDLTELNHNGLIHSSIGKEQLTQITSEYLDLLGTSTAIYEINGDYAIGLFSSSWCQLMNGASRKLCRTANNAKALRCGKWLCHESCWRDASMQAMKSGNPIDVSCVGGMRLYAVPIRANGAIIGAINFGHGMPPDDETTLQTLSDLYQIPIETMQKARQQYKVRPKFIIDYAKERIQVSARHIGSLVERQQAETALRESEEKFRHLFESSNDAHLIFDRDRYLDGNDTCLKMLGFAKREDFLSLPPKAVFPPRQPDGRSAAEMARTAIDLAMRTGTYSTEWVCRKKDGSHIHVEALLNRVQLQGRPVIHSVWRDITERKQAEAYREISREILQILNEPGNLQESIQHVLDTMKTRTEVDAVGLRLQDGEDFPYFAQNGFTKKFLRSENTLIERGKQGGLCRDKNGNVRLECTCGLVISGQTDPANPLFTQGGSFWTNDAFPLLELSTDLDPRLHPRNNCIHHGYASVALIPIRIKEQIVGLIQLNDKRKNRFSLATIEMLESIAAHIGSALMRKRTEEELTQTQAVLRTLLGRLEQAREEERTRISRDMHDDLGQNITAIKMDLSWIERMTEGAGTPDIPVIRARATAAIKMVDSIALTVQELAASLRPGVLDKLGVGPAIRFESRRFQTRTGIECQANLSDALPDIPPATATTVFRIFQECLTNIARHAKATRASVRLGIEANNIILRVHDNGKGIAPEAVHCPESLGLLGMRERAADAGGEILVRGGKKRGTLVTIRIPI